MQLKTEDLSYCRFLQVSMAVRQAFKQVRCSNLWSRPCYPSPRQDQDQKFQDHD